MNSCNTSQEMSCHDEEDLDIPDILEDIIELLLSGLRDTVCRGFLSADLGALSYILSSFPTESHMIS